jgi:hypothetical protein
VRDRSSEFNEPDSHAKYCPVKHTKSALFLIAYFSLAGFVNWRGLHKGPAPPDLIILFFAMLVTVMLGRAMVDFTCFRERFVFGIAIVMLVIGEVERFAPSLFGQHIEVEKAGRLALSLLGLLVSLSMFVPLMGPDIGEPKGTRR